MKTRQWLFAALTALLLAGCSTETDLARPDDDVNPPVPEGMTRLSFEIKGVRTGTSYADATAPLTEDESQLKDMIVILFPQAAGGKPLATDVAQTVLKAKVGKTAQGAPKAEVLLDKAVPEGTYYAVIIANFGSLTQGRITNLDEQFEYILPDIKGKTYLALFSAANRMLGYAGYREDVSVKDFGLAMKALATGIKVAAVANRGDNIPLTVTMKRPMARFDIKNSAWQSFSITGYRAKNIREIADLCPAPDDVPNWTGNDVMDEYNATTYSAERADQLNRPSDHDNNATTDPVIAYAPAFYLCPGLATDQSFVEIMGELEVGGKIVPLTVTIPFVTGTPETPIAITANKRYKIELTLSQGNDDVVGSVLLDEGTWDEGDGTGGGDNIEQKLPGEILDPSAGTTYANVDAANGTFTAPEGATEFTFRLVATSNTIKVADGADAGIITSVVGTPTLAPSTTYTVKMADAGNTGKLVEMGKDKDGNPVTVKTYTVNRKELPIDPTIYPPTNLTTTLVGNIYWSPVNVGATSVGDPGLLYQYGRMKGWASVDAMNAAKVYQQIPIADADKEPDICYLKNAGSDNNWWPDSETTESIKALTDRWSAVSNGSNNPCPRGWRLPTKADVDALLLGETPTYDSVNKKATVRGLVFSAKEYFVSEYGGGRQASSVQYWLADYRQDWFVSTSSSHFSTSDSNISQSSNGQYIRCVTDKK